jgi:hypothetical protein
MLLTVICCGVVTRAGSEQEHGSDLTAARILKELAWKQDEDLHEFIRFLDYTFDRSHLTDQEIDRIVDRLRVIQEGDPYHSEFDGKGGRYGTFPNRHAARQCIFNFRFQKIANALRRLPLEQRVQAIVAGIENPPAGFEYETTFSFSEELVRAGEEAVPFVIQHRPRMPYHRRAIVFALVEIGDPRGLDYIVEVLHTRDDSFRFERPYAAKALGKLGDARAVPALVDALRDNTSLDIDRHMPPTPGIGHQPYVGRLYSVRHAAAQSLTTLTGRDWGLFYNEDYRTWSAWLGSDHPETFSPAELERSDREVEQLLAFMFHRYMSARPNPWQPRNELATADGVRSLAAELKRLGRRVVPLLVDELRARIGDTPAWEDELRQWTRELLLALAWTEAAAAAEKLAPVDGD